MTHASGPEPLDAAAWDARLRRPDCSSDDRAQFAAWLAADAEHARSFERLQAILIALRENAARPQLRAHRDRALKRSAPVYALVAAVIAALAGLLATSYFLTPWTQMARAPGEVRQYATQLGERREFTLEDGSILTLNTNSIVEASLAGRERQLRLIAGQAYVAVAHDESRPFVVEALGRTVTALGTEFDLSIERGALRVVLVEGRVAVAAHGGLFDLGGRRTEISAGQALTVSPGGDIRVLQADVERMTLWRHGRVSFADTPLPEAIAEMNRYSAAQIVLADPSMAQLRVNGVFRTGQQATFVRVLESYYPIEVREEPGGDLLLVWRADRNAAE
ncbi:MAG TPA: FecR domain-containing protein [Vitreimonas sp.]|uniref:FecR family protein n=1 Tax=Vitreimonas sp. TaxID=3069702 RepID=UPI002D2DF0B0|nr:FecR domain-containing protein [Vitreimonas sp.]HYD86121.1 FecR domain-containing protein [Vitreimonas sp.]